MKSTWIQNAEMVPENKPYKVDSSGRIIVPAHLRAKFGIDIGDEMDYYTTFVDNKWFVCVTKKMDKGEDVVEE